MAMPNYDQIHEYFLNGKWNERMLRTAQVCKAITAEQVDTIIADKKAYDSKVNAVSAEMTRSAAKKKVRKTSSSKSK